MHGGHAESMHVRETSWNENGGVLPVMRSHCTFRRIRIFEMRSWKMDSLRRAICGREEGVTSGSSGMKSRTGPDGAISRTWMRIGKAVEGVDSKTCRSGGNYRI